jgi:hypothetical protein
LGNSDSSSKPAEGDPTVRFILEFRNQSKLAKWSRTLKTRQNWDCYWERHDFAHKIPGQSRETLSMQPMAVEQTAAFFQQALVDIGTDWFKAAAKNPRNLDKLKVRPQTIDSLTKFQVGKAEIMKHVVKGVKSGLLGSVFITKVHGYPKPIPYYTASGSKQKKNGKLSYSKKKSWQLCLDLVNDFNYYPDPTGEGLGECEDMWMDYHKVVALSEGDDAIYDKKIVKQIEHLSGEDAAEERFDEMRKSAQNAETRTYRNRVKLTEYWGTILGENGEVEYENCVCTLANDRWLIRPPQPNPLWHQESPYEVTPLLEAPYGVWPRALMDSPTRHNIAANEIYNLMLDGAMRAANCVTEIRQDWLEDPAQVSGGILPGTSLNLNSMAQPGVPAVSVVKTGEVPPEAMNMFNTMQQEFNRAALTSDIRQGMQPRKDVPATQIVEANQTITSVFSGLSKNIEGHIQRVLEKSWMTSCQFSDDMDEDELRTVLDEDQADDFLKMTAEERFAETVGGIKFTVSGISLMQQRAQDYKKDTNLAQTIFASQPMEEAFVKKYSVEKLLDRMMRNLGIRTDEIELSQAEQDQMNQPPPQPGGQDPNAQPPGPQGPNNMSQVPSPGSGSLQQQMGSAAPVQSTMAAQAAQGRPK